MKNTLQTAFNPRQYMLSKDFEIFYYSDTTMKNVKDHTHDYYEFYFLLSGQVAINISGVDHPLKTGDMILIPPNRIHHVRILDQSVPYQRIVLWVADAYWQKLLKQSPDYGYLPRQALVREKYVYSYDVVTFNVIRSKIFQLIEEIHAERFGRLTKIALCLSDLLLHLNRTVYEMAHPSTPQQEQSLYQRLIIYIEAHISEELSLECLARKFYVSKYHIAHVFKQNMGLSVYQYILRKRLIMCRDAIIANTKISEAYLQCGFKDYSNFYRAFKKEYGLSPSDYQQLYAHVPPSDPER